MGWRLAAAMVAALAAAITVLVILIKAARSHAAGRGELARLAEQAAQQADRIQGQDSEIAGLRQQAAGYAEREQEMLAQCAELRDSGAQLRAAQAQAVLHAVEHTMTKRLPAALDGDMVPPEAEGIDADLADLLEQGVAAAAAAGERLGSARSAVVVLARRVQASAHRIQQAATEMADRHPGNTDVMEVSMQVDHAAAQQARQAQSLAVLCGEMPGQQWAEPLPLVDVVHAAAGRIIAYRRVEVAGDLDLAAAAPVVEPLIHLVAELLANATQSSPPATAVPVTVRTVQRGAVIEVNDCGVGLDDYRLEQAREIASGKHPVSLEDLGEVPQTGLPVVGQFVRRYGLRLDLAESVYGGVHAIVGIPAGLVETMEPAGSAPVPAAAAPGTRSPEPAPPDGSRPGLPRRHSPRHEGPPDRDGTEAAQAGDAPGAAKQTPEQAGAWMGAFLGRDDDKTEQQEQ